MATTSPVPLGSVFAGKYRVDRVLGEGGMGIVVAAYHLELEQNVAIKFLLDGSAGSKEGEERFRREARAAAKIQSDHVVRVLDVGLLESGERYMVMEYMDGRDLADELQALGSFPVETATTFILEALDAIGHAHLVGIVHRDLKPGNLFLARRPDGSVRVKVLDFGISKTFGSASAAELSLTKTSAWMGSPLYMSPEQMQSARDVDQRADIWSMGAIYYELLTGRPPYLAESLPQLCNLLLTVDPDDIRTLRADIPHELGETIMRCLSRNVATRVQSAQELAQLIAPFAAQSSGRQSRLPILDLDRTAVGPTAAGRFTAGSGTSSQPGAFAQTVTGGHTATVPGPAPSKKWGWIVGAAALLIGGLGFFLVTSKKAEPQQEALVATQAPSAAVSAAAASPVAAAAAEPASAAEPVAPATGSAPTVGGGPAKPLARPGTAKPKPATTAAPATTATASDTGLSDFGGRR